MVSLWQPPPRGRKMTPERPFPAIPVLIETGKSDPKTGLFPAVFRRFSDSFASGLPADFRRFSSGSTPVFQRFSGLSTAVLPTVFQRFDAGFPTVFPAVRRRFSSGLPAVFQRFTSGFLGKFDGGWTTVFQQHASPGSTPVRLRRTSSSERNCRAIPYTLSGVQTQHSGIFESVFVTKRLAKLAGTNKN